MVLRLVLVVLMMMLVMFFWLGLVVVVLVVLGQVALQRMLEQVAIIKKTIHTAESSVATSRGTWYGLGSWCS